MAKKINPKLPLATLDDVFKPPRTPGGKGTPGGNNGALHRKYNPPQPKPRPPTNRVRKGS